MKLDVGFCVFCAHLRMSSTLDNYMKLISFLHHCTTIGWAVGIGWVCVWGWERKGKVQGGRRAEGRFFCASWSLHQPAWRTEVSFKYYVVWPIKSKCAFGFSNFKCYWMPKLILFVCQSNLLKKRGHSSVDQFWLFKKTSSPNFNFIIFFFWEITYGFVNY